MTTVCDSVRLTLRHATTDDAAFVLHQVNEPDWVRNIGDRKVRSLDDARAYIETRMLAPYRALGYGMYVIELKANSEPIGMCGLVKRDYLPDPDIGFSLLQAYWGKGYALEAARAVVTHARKDLGISRLLAIVSPGNTPSERLLVTLGFRLEPEPLRIPTGETLRQYVRNEPA